MKTIDIVSGTYLTLPNGLSKFLNTLNQYRNIFLRREVDLRIFTLDSIKPLTLGIVTTKKREFVKSNLIKLAKISHLITWLLLDRTILRHARNIADYYEGVDEKGTIVVFQDFFSCYYYLKRKREKKTKIYLTMHNKGDMWQMIASTYPLILSPLFARYRRNVEKIILTHCDKIGFVSQASQENFINTYLNYNSQKTYFVYNGIPLKKEPLWHHSQIPIKLVCVATLNKRKNQIGILEALHALSKQDQEKFVLTFVGDGPERPALEKFSNQLATKVIFVGSVNDVTSYLEEADVFILYAKEEGLPISILEAMSVGLPIIGSNVDGIPEEIINGKTGFLVNLNTKDLCDIFMYILDNVNMLPALGRKSYDLYLERFTVNSMINSYVELFNDD